MRSACSDVRFRESETVSVDWKGHVLNWRAQYGTGGGE